ncbi:MAG: NADPH:quinone reductase [Deltaproteobacteria bacterium]|nr:NADPH:quinone reductase [Deltaproteobacteria bacterium]
MKAIRVHEFGAPEVMRLEDIGLRAPGPNEALIDIKAVGVNPVDAYIRAGLFYARELPFTPGADAGGVVEAIGDNVTRFKPGDRVYTAGTITGAYAEKSLCRETQLHLLTEKLSFAQGACVGVPYATAYRALFQRGMAVAGETVLIHGATGGVGTAAVQLARAAGLTVIGTAGTEDGKSLVLKEGAHFVVNHKDEGHLKAASAFAKNGINLIIEFLANANLGADLEFLAKHGRVVVVGSRGTVEVDPRDAMSRDLDIRGMSLFNADDMDLASIHAGLMAGFENGSLCPVVGRELPLKDAARAHHEIMEKSAHGKIILVP